MYLYMTLSKGEEGKKEPSDIYQQYAIAMKTSYQLPNGTKIDLPQIIQFDITELSLGKEGVKSVVI